MFYGSIKIQYGMILFMNFHRVMANLIIHRWFKAWRYGAHVIINWHFRNWQIVTSRARAHLFYYHSHTRYQRFRAKPVWPTYDFSWLFFDKIKSQKRCKGMLNHTQQRPLRNFWRWHLSWSMVRKNSFDVLIMPVWGSDIVCIRAWY